MGQRYTRHQWFVFHPPPPPYPPAISFSATYPYLFIFADFACLPFICLFRCFRSLFTILAIYVYPLMNSLLKKNAGLLIMVYVDLASILDPEYVLFLDDVYIPPGLKNLGPQSKQSAKLFSSRRNWDSPNSSPSGECDPPPLVPRGGAHSLASERVGESRFRRGNRHCGTLSAYISTMCHGHL